MNADISLLDSELVIRTPRLVLRAPDEQDLPAVWDAVYNSSLCEALGWQRPTSMSDLHDAHTRNLRLWREGRQYVFSARCAQSRAFIGRVALERDETDTGWRLAYWVAPQAAGRGYGTEMARVAVGLSLSTLRARRVSATCAVSNPASARVLEKAGMRCTGRSGLLLNGRRVPARSYAAFKTA